LGEEEALAHISFSEPVVTDVTLSYSVTECEPARGAIMPGGGRMLSHGMRWQLYFHRANGL